MADRKELERKWKESGMTCCRSASEFLLRLEIAKLEISEPDLEYLADCASRDCEFCKVMYDLAVDTNLFNKALSDLDFYIDYYMAMSSSEKPDPLKFGRIRLLDKYETGAIRRSLDDSFLSFLQACADSADGIFEGKLEHASRFSAKIASMKAKARERTAG